MSDREQIIHFSEEIDRLVNRFRQEYDITYGSLIGCLQTKIVFLVLEAKENSEDDE